MRPNFRGYLFGFMLFSVSYIHQEKFDGPTPVSRLDLLHAIVQEGSVRINRYHENTPDKAVFKGDYYSDKAPGTVALALLPFLLASELLALCGIPLDSQTGWLASSWIACVASIGVIAALGAVALFSWLQRWTSVRTSLVITVAVFLGAAPLPYATMMFSHALVVGLLAIALLAIRKQEEEDSSYSVLLFQSEQTTVSSLRRSVRWLRPNKWDLLAGHTCGWALASEYTAGIVVLGVFAHMTATRWTRGIPWCLGALPALLLVPGYSYLCFGTPFTLPYSLQASFPAMQEGLYAIKWPDPETGAQLLLSPTRGLLFWSPFLLILLIGRPHIAQRDFRHVFLAYLVPLIHVIVMSGRVWDWTAGPTLGPRYLAPILPLVALPCAITAATFLNTTFIAVAYSVLITTLATMTDAAPRDSIYNPLIELHLPRFIQGQFSPNLGLAVGLPPFVSVGLYYAVLIAGICWLWRMLPKEKTCSAEAKTRTEQSV